MPEALTHRHFGRKVLKDFPELNGMIRKNGTVFDYGTMGPDVLYGLKLGSDVWKGEWGEYAHGHFVKESFVRAARTLENTKRDRLWRDRFAYVLGLLSHYVLDSRTHPYVYEFEHNRLTGKVEPDFEEHKHKLVEAAFDYHVLVDYEGKSNKERSYQLFRWNGRPAKTMQDFFNYVVGDLYPFEISGFDRVFASNVFALVAFFSHKSSRLKYRFTRFVEKKTGFKHLLTAGYRTGLGRPDWDILNLNRLPFDLVSGGAGHPSTETFDEVFARALRDANRYFEAFLRAVGGDFSGLEALDFSLDYDGLPVKDEPSGGNVVPRGKKKSAFGEWRAKRKAKSADAPIPTANMSGNEPKDQNESDPGSKPGDE